MENTPDNNTSSSSAHNPAQNELDLGFGQMEPITPKKPLLPEQSMFERAKNMFGRKEAAEHASYSARKEPTFGEPDLGRQVKEIVSDTISEAKAKLNNEARAAATSASAAFAGESAGAENTADTPHGQSGADADDLVEEFEKLKSKAAPEKNVAAEKNMKNPENWALMQKLPPRHRRLIIALAAVLIVLSVFFWLKPDSHTVEDFQAQNINVQPIEFQPLDQTKIAETAVANANDVADMLDNATQPDMDKPEAAPANAANTTQVTPPAQNEPAAATAQAPAVSAKQAERTPPAETPKAQPAQSEPKTAAKTNRQQAVTEQRGQRQQQNRRTNATANAAANENRVELPSAVAAKTLTVTQGVSLMQVFRDNNLSVADVNAMTKVKGAESVLSSFKSGDKVQVFLNRQGRVSTLRLSNGATFTRQPDGSYKYTK